MPCSSHSVSGTPAVRKRSRAAWTSSDGRSLEAEVGRARRRGRDLALAEGEEAAFGAGEDQQVRVVVDAPGQAEVLAVERRRAIAIGDGQCDVIEAEAAHRRIGRGGPIRV